MVDNFLKRKIKGTKTIYVSDIDTTVKYSKTKDEARCYNRIEKTEDYFESDILASTDDEPDLRFRCTDGTEKLLAWERSFFEVVPGKILRANISILWKWLFMNGVNLH